MKDGSSAQTQKTPKRMTKVTKKTFKEEKVGTTVERSLQNKKEGGNIGQWTPGHCRTVKNAIVGKRTRGMCGRF